MKYAIVENGGKQYKAVEGETIEVDRMPLDVGKKVDLKDVLLVVDGKEISVGTPKVSGAKVTATVVDQFKAPKIIVFKYKSRQRYRVKQGHRQQYTRLLIEDIITKTAAKKAEAEPEAKPEAKAKVKAKTKAAPKTKAKAKVKTKAAPKTKTKTKAAPKTKAKTKATPKTKAKTKAKAKTKTASKTKTKTKAKTTTKKTTKKSE
jgi:large subunit ribosomal protein L21